MALGYYTQATTSHSWYVNEDMDLGPSRGVLKIIWGGGRKKISGIYVILQHVRILGICLLGLAHNIKLMLWMTFFFFFSSSLISLISLLLHILIKGASCHCKHCPEYALCSERVYNVLLDTQIFIFSVMVKLCFTN